MSEMDILQVKQTAPYQLGFADGLAAGIERAAKCAEYPCADSVCAAAIRALLK